MLHCIKIKENFCAVHDEKPISLDKPDIKVWRVIGRKTGIHFS
jgi:hypothetical protein